MARSTAALVTPISIRQNKLEFSAVTGITYNFENPSTQYQNSHDFHLDTGASYFQQINVGAVGYFFQRVTGDRGLGATLGPFESRVAGIGPGKGRGNLTRAALSYQNARS
jgi:hypothetical protein